MLSSFFNVSSLGPVLQPCHLVDCVRLLTDYLHGDMHLFGVTINVLTRDMTYCSRYSNVFDHAAPYSHVQSYAFAITQECFRYLVAKGVWEGADGIDNDTAIVQREIRISQEFKANGWNLSCFLPPYNWIDCRQEHVDPNPASDFGHPVSRNAYFGSTLHPYEVVFVKTGWGIVSPERLAFYSAIALRDRPAALLGEWPEAQILQNRLWGESLSSLSAHSSAFALAYRWQPSRLRLFPALIDLACWFLACTVQAPQPWLDA